jgi:hypothetical protein
MGEANVVDEISDTWRLDDVRPSVCTVRQSDNEPPATSGLKAEVVVWVVNGILGGTESG